MPISFVEIKNISSFLCTLCPKMFNVLKDQNFRSVKLLFKYRCIKGNRHWYKKSVMKYTE